VKELAFGRVDAGVGGNRPTVKASLEQEPTRISRALLLRRSGEKKRLLGFAGAQA